MKKTLITLTVLLFTMHSAHGQFITGINPANTGDPRFIFANPAIADSGVAPFIVAGYQRLFTGLPLLNNKLIGIVLPTAQWGAFALTAPGFSSELFYQSAAEMRYAYTFATWRTALGFNAGAMLTSYNRKKYRLVDVNDPLLLGNQSLNVFNVGLGATVKPIDKLTIGLSADHLNRPRLSFEGDMRREVRLQAGAMGEYGPFRPMAMWEREDGQIYWSLGGEAWLRNISVLDALMLRVYYGSEFFTIGAALQFNNFRFDFVYDFARGDFGALTSGSPQFVMTRRFEKEPCTSPPVAHAAALQDTFYFGPTLYHKKMIESKDIEWLTPAMFVKDSVVYEILNPQANPFLNYIFFKANSEHYAYKPDMLSELCRYYEWSCKNSGAKIRLIGHISGGMNKDCSDPTCEHSDSLITKRVKQVESILKKHNIAKEYIYVKSDNSRFSNCIEQEALLKTERQRVDVQIVDADSRLVSWPYAFTRKDDEIQDCAFDFFGSKAACGWKKWNFGIWRLDGDKKRAVAQSRGKKMPPFGWTWPLQTGYMSSDSTTQHFYYRLRVADNSANTDDAFSAVRNIVVGKSPRPKKLLVLFNFDRYAEILGDSALTPEGREKAYDSWESKDCAELMDSTSEELESMLKACLTPLAQSKNVQIERIVGYTDSIGDEDYNQSLSLDRARLVKCYLIKQFHLPVFNVPTEGLGEKNPIASNATPAGRWLNRRVEVVIEYLSP